MNTDLMREAAKEFMLRHGKKIKSIMPDEEERGQYLGALFLEMEQNGVLQTCSQESIFEVALNLAHTGLNPASVYQEVHVYPFGGKNAVEKKATMVIGYRGMIALAIRSGMVEDIHADIVYQGDRFEHNLGSAPFITHEKTLDHDTKQAQFYYAAAALKNGLWKVYVMTRNEADAFKNKIAGPYSLWHDASNFDAMARKQCIRMLLNLLPKRPMYARAIAAEERLETPKLLEEPKANRAPAIDTQEAKKISYDNEHMKQIQKLARKLNKSSVEIEDLYTQNGGDSTKVLAELQKLEAAQGQNESEKKAEAEAEEGSTIESK